MSYIPPHKRHSKDPDRPSPVPDSLAPKFQKNLHFNSSSSDKHNRIVYSGESISRWFLIGSNGTEDEIPPSAKLVPLSSDSVQCKKGEKPSILMNTNDHKQSEEEDERTKWLLIAEKVAEDLVLAYERAKSAMDGENQNVLRLVASFGKNFFYGHRAIPPIAECSQKPSNKIFSTDVPTSYLHHIKSQLVPNHGFCIDLEKERYTVKVSHHTRPNETINCKCTVKEDGRLIMYKVDLNPVRHLVIDVSCIEKNLDMRLMLSAKRIITDLTEKEISDVKGLLDSATVDPNVKGGLRWPFLSQAELNPLRHLVIDVSCIDKNLDMRLMLAGKRKAMTLTEKETNNIQGLLDSATVDSNVIGGLRWPLGKPSSENGYTIFKVCHVRATTYKNRTLRLSKREADRFNERFGTRGFDRGVTLVLQDINTKLQEKNIERGCVLGMLRDALGTIWDFLHCDASLT